MADQVFRSGCGHTPEDEQFDFCPICRISELETAYMEGDKLFHQIADQRDELQRKHEALVEKGRHIIANYDEWDDVLPNECIDRLRALLGDEIEELTDD